MENADRYDRTAERTGILVLPMSPAGEECIMGAICDQTFGPTVMFGLGGIFVEVLKDVSFRVAPITLAEAREMIEEIKGYPILHGIRGKQGVDVDALAESLRKLSILMVSEPDIAEIDLNPVFATADGLNFVDVRIILHPEER
jgi:acyl-CoA synthetase (NDP forming)